MSTSVFVFTILCAAPADNNLNNLHHMSVFTTCNKMVFLVWKAFCFHVGQWKINIYSILENISYLSTSYRVVGNIVNQILLQYEADLLADSAVKIYRTDIASEDERDVILFTRSWCEGRHKYLSKARQHVKHVINITVCVMEARMEVGLSCPAVVPV